MESFAFGGEDAVSISTGGGRAGKINLDSFQIAKGFDSCSGVLVTEFLRGSTIPQVVLETRQSGGPSAGRADGSDNYPEQRGDLFVHVEQR